MKLPQIILVVLLSAVVAFVTVRLTAQNATGANTESAYAQIMRTNTLRCGYNYWDGAVMRDKQGKLYGPWVDIMNAVGEALGLKIDWVAQVGWDEVGAALKSHKIDAMCAGMWTSALKTREIAFSTPVAYQAVEAFVASGSHIGKIAELNDKNVKISVIDGDNSDFIAQQDFSVAQRVALGQMNGTDADLMMYVMSGKADATFTITGLWRLFDKSNPGRVKRLDPATKLRVFGLGLAIDNQEPHLLQMLNAAIQENQNSGRLDKILDKANEEWPDMFIKPLKPFP